MYRRLSIVDCRLHGIAGWHSNRKSKIENRKSVAGVKAQATIEYLLIAAAVIGAFSAFAPMLKSQMNTIDTTAMNKLTVTDPALNYTSVVKYIQNGIPKDKAKRDQIP